MMTRPKPGEVFIDIGSGTGLPCAVAAVMFPELAMCEGIEYLESLT